MRRADDELHPAALAQARGDHPGRDRVRRRVDHPRRPALVGVGDPGRGGHTGPGVRLLPVGTGLGYLFGLSAYSIAEEDPADNPDTGYPVQTSANS